MIKNAVSILCDINNSINNEICEIEDYIAELSEIKNELVKENSMNKHIIKKFNDLLSNLLKIGQEV